ncbi:MAG TPA: PEP-CTERM sorting domain-containing protein [Verrucomicrobiae bacterium]|nr:PEP-CTERM sorting domain-containing protein [Verrucomicrobiae bacterium]
MELQKFWTKFAGLAFVSFSLNHAALAINPPGTTSTNNFSVGQTIPDNTPSGLTETQTLDFSGTGLVSITDIEVTLNISGGFNGDYYGYLVHNDGFAILLNRVGRTSTDTLGYGDSGLNITLESGANDIHTYQTEFNPGGVALTGLWDVDGRNVDPQTVTDTDPRTATLGSFVGQDPSGQWTLFLADVHPGSEGQLVNWGLVITSVPEPGTLALLALGLSGVVVASLRRRG